MNKIIVSAGIVALGVTAVHAASAPALTSTEKAKAWNVSASLRGFYDDNYATQPSGPNRRNSFGFELSPKAWVNLTSDQTQFRASYKYAMRYYDDRPSNTADHTHQADISLSHAFTEKNRLTLSDSFVIAQEPTLLNPTFVAGVLRANGNNIRNTADVTYDWDISDIMSLGVGYQNVYYNYDGAQYSAVLDRMEHLPSINFRYAIARDTKLIVGYQFGVVRYSDDSFLDAPVNTIPSSSRDYNSHYYYLGVDHNFTPQMTGMLRLGAQTVDYRLTGLANNTSPYVDASLSYRYQENSYAQLGVKHQATPTEYAGVTATGFTRDAEATFIYGYVNHSFTPKIVASLNGQYQMSEFRGGALNNQSEDFFTMGLNVSYAINEFLSADTGYNYDLLSSKTNPYHRNVVYIGIRATY